jgi:hypothetical protein
MLSRALISATVALLIGGFAAAPAPVQAQNLEAGKSPSQIFAGTCTACHKSARGLLKTVPAGSLTGFLRQHYTTSPEMAGLLSGFLISNGASDTRYGGGRPKAGKPAEGPPEQLDRQGRRLRGATTSQEPATPGAESQQGTQPDSAGRRGRNAKRLARPVEGEAATAAVSEPGPDGRKRTAKHRLGRRGKPSLAEPSSSKGDAAGAGSAKGEPPREEMKPAAESAKDESVKSDSVKPSAEGVTEATKPDVTKSEAVKSEPVKSEAPKEAGNPVPPVTPAPTPPSAPAAASSAPEPASSSPSTSAAPPAPAAAVPAVVDPAPVAPGSSAPPTSK